MGKKEIAMKILEMLEHNKLIEKAEIAGSIRRKKKDVRDIDIVVIPNDWMQLKARMQFEYPSKVIVSGDKIFRIEIDFNHDNEWIQVDFYRATIRDFIPLLLTYTGSKIFNISMRANAKAKGMMLSQYGLFDRKGSPISMGFKEEKEIFDALDMKYKKPEERE